MELTAFENSFFDILFYLSLILGSLSLSLLIGLVRRSGGWCPRKDSKGMSSHRDLWSDFMSWSYDVYPPAVGCMPGVMKIASIGTLFEFLILVSGQLVFPYNERIASLIPSRCIIL